MTHIGYHASHEQFSPSHLLALAQQAEVAGFSLINCSDHFHPWSERQGHSGFSFTWLGAAMHACSLPFSVVCAPGYRYHPAVVAQAIATLGDMFPGRFSINLGSGEALNESITGEKWPTKSQRNDRLHECYQVIQKLLSGETVSYKGQVVVEDARIYSRPATPPALNGAAVTKQTAAWMGSWVDGLITVYRPLTELQEVIDAFRKNGGAAKPISVKVQISYARDLRVAEEGALDQWRTNVLPSNLLAGLSKVHEFDAAAESVTLGDVKTMVEVSNNAEQFVELIQSIKSLHVNNIIIHNVNRDQETFIEDFSKFVLPRLKES